MAEYDNPRPTSQPVGSTDQAVAKDNLITYDKLVNSTDLTVENRKGAELRTLAGNETYINEKITAAVASAGYQIVGDFADSPKVQITEENQVYTSKSIVGSEDALWRTNQTLPYTPTGSDPTVAPELGKWIVVAQGELKGIARSLNVLDSQVIYSTDTTTVLDGVLYIYNSSTQEVYRKDDSVGAGEYIVSVTGSVLTTDAGVYDIYIVRDGFINATDSQLSSVIPLISESWFNATDNTVHMGDGATQGGHKIPNVFTEGHFSAGALLSNELKELDNITGQKFIPDGNYIFEEENLTEVANINLFKNAVVSNSIYDGIMQKDADVAWLHHNHLEEKNNGSYQAITSGNIPEAPLYNGLKQNHTNVMAFWYQDFGLDATRQAQGAIGSVTWYYWEWLFHTPDSGEGYDPKRHPLLGYYRGDDPIVSDWQCYWLNEAGVTTILPQSRGTNAQIGDIQATWASASDVNHWMYQLFNNAKNFKQLNYSLWFNEGNGVFGDTANQTAMSNSIDSIISLYNAYQNVNTITHNGGTYAVVFCWDITKLSGTFDNFSGYANAKLWLIDQTAKFQVNGFDGMCVLGRNNSTQLVGDADLEDAGCLVYSTAYVDTYNPNNNGGITPAVTYQDLAQGVDVRVSTSFAYNQSVPAISTDRDSHDRHPTTWDWAGSAPDLFEVMARNCLKRMELRGSPRMMMVYNVSEWAEGGASLNANMRDGKGYLNALRSAINTVSQGVKNIGYSGDVLDVDSITLPDSGGTGTPSSNVMSDYEEGEFYPVVSDASSGGNVGIPSITYGFYTRIGRMVTAIIQMTNINTSGMTGTNDVFIQNLPFAVSNLAGTQRYVGSVRLNAVIYNGQVLPETEDTVTYLKLIDIVSGGVGDYLSVQDITSGQGDIYLSLSYFAS